MTSPFMKICRMYSTNYRLSDTSILPVTCTNGTACRPNVSNTGNRGGGQEGDGDCASCLVFL